MNKFVAYYRVSTEGQSFDPQKEVVSAYVKKDGGVVVAEFAEVASGDVFGWPKFKAAIEEARRLAVPLIVANSTRVSRHREDVEKIEAQVIFVSATGE
jgi:DNA invertase Pin-like site-specific DNA recombinase